MKKTFFLLLLMSFTITMYSYSQKAFGYSIPKKITYEILRGSWIAKDSRHLKIFKSDHLQFNSLDAACYLKSVWSFETDSTGNIAVPASKICPELRQMKFNYQLLESQTGYGPSYKLSVRFENGLSDDLYIGEWDGKNKIKMGYKQKSIDVTIVYNFQKKD